MSDEPIPISRQQRRAAARAAIVTPHVERTAIKPAPLCAPGTHAYAELVGTMDDKPVARAVVCTACRRTFQQVMEESPDDLAMYRAFLEAEKAKVEHGHEPDPDGLPVEGCAGCQRIANLDHSDPDELG